MAGFQVDYEDPLTLVANTNGILVIRLSATSEACSHSRFLARRHEPKVWDETSRELAENRGFAGVLSLRTGQLCWLTRKRVALNTTRQLIRKIADPVPFVLPQFAWFISGHRINVG
jgi:hypothetical protein